MLRGWGRQQKGLEGYVWVGNGRVHPWTATVPLHSRGGQTEAVLGKKLTEGVLSMGEAGVVAAGVSV
eukprot:753886-Hanusia_phi.AAC.1